MTNRIRTARAWHISLWTAQVLIAVVLAFGGYMKAFRPVIELAAMWSWTGELPAAAVRITGLLDLLGMAGLILPGMLHIQPRLTILAAGSVATLMICAALFHIARGEGSDIGINIFLAALAVFVVWGRQRKAPFK